MSINPSQLPALAWFVHIARHRSFTKAATEMEMSRADGGGAAEAHQHVRKRVGERAEERRVGVRAGDGAGDEPGAADGQRGRHDRAVSCVWMLDARWMIRGGYSRLYPPVPHVSKTTIRVLGSNRN